MHRLSFLFLCSLIVVLVNASHFDTGHRNGLSRRSFKHAKRTDVEDQCKIAAKEEPQERELCRMTTWASPYGIPGYLYEHDSFYRPNADEQTESPINHDHMRSTIDRGFADLRGSQHGAMSFIKQDEAYVKRQLQQKNRQEPGNSMLNDNPSSGVDRSASNQTELKNSTKGRQAIPQNGPEAESQSSAPQRAMDYTKLVNPFIGTGATSNPGNVFPGASVPFGMAKIGVDVDSYAPAGYNDDLNAPIRGCSINHDSGTGSSSGSFGLFETMPVICSNDDYQLCPTILDNRKRLRAPGKDVASPGYFSTTLNNSIKIEVTSTRRAGLIRYTWPESALNKQKAKNPHLVMDWTNDLPGTFRGGHMNMEPSKGRVTFNGTWGSSFASGLFSYNAYACYDLHANGQQSLDKYGLWAGDRFGQDTKEEGEVEADLVRNTVGGQPVQAGALVSWKKTMQSGSLTKRLLPLRPGALRSQDKQVLIRAGLSYVSPERACQNAEEEIPEFNFEKVVSQSKQLWNEKLNRIHIANTTNDTIAELFYTSFYRSFLSPNNATLEGQKEFANTRSPFFDGLYCTWDTFRTFYPMLSLTSPFDYAEIVETYIDGWRKQGFIPECRANLVPGLTQGGSDGTNVLADYAVKYGKEENLDVNIKELYQALRSDAYTNAKEWNNGGRQIGVYVKYGYIPFAVFDRETTGRQTREGSRTLEYCENDFGIRNVALMLGEAKDAEDLTRRAYFYKNVFDPNTKSLGYSNFVQKRYTNGTFAHVDPLTCSPLDSDPEHACSLQQENVYGVYETSSFEYSFYAPHDFAGLIKLISNGDREDFVKRVDTFFEKGIYYAGNEPSFQTTIAYTYANEPARSVDRVRQTVLSNFNTTNGGLPGNDDNAAMATLLLFQLMGIYPVPSTREFVVISPFLPTYTINNELLGSVTIQAINFDPTSLVKKVPEGSRAYVSKVLINGKEQSSRCKIMFEQLFAGKGKHTDIVFEMTADRQAANSCGKSASDLPSSLSTGGFDRF